jgi:preprotein translocase subunit SecA
MVMMRAVPVVREYPMKVAVDLSPFDHWSRAVLARIVSFGPWVSVPGAGKVFLRQVAAFASGLVALDDAALLARTQALRPALRRAVWYRSARPAALAEGFALICEQAARSLGQRPFEVQMLAARSILQGHIAEMATGEGKSLSATLAASTLALAGTPVHVMTVNDYLAERDFTLFSPLFHAMGLRVGVVLEGQTPDQRRAAYACDVVYGTAKEIVFDHLRDRMILRQRPGNLARKLDRILSVAGTVPRAGLTMRGMPAAIVDEADSVLLDQAGTPFVLSGLPRIAGGLAPDVLRLAMTLALDLRAGVDFVPVPRLRIVELTDAGRQALAAQTAKAEGPMTVPAIRTHAVTQALNALHIFERDRDYLVAEGKVQIIDETTGRVMPDRTWSDGLHQMVEIKEGVDLTLIFETTARITLQKFFQRYQRLGGMTGTARSAARELWQVYGLHVRPIPTRLPSKRRIDQFILLPDRATKWRAVTDLVGDLHRQGHPVLVGTKTVAASDQVSAMLGDVPHQVLNAHKVRAEAAIIADAGTEGRVTVATNMAGRGTDILLSDAARASGGLYVILTELHDSRRIDLQLYGRSGRQGDPGRVIRLISLEDDLLLRRGCVLRALARAALRFKLPQVGVAVLRWCQWREDLRQARGRTDLIRREEQRDRQLAISGRSE